MKNYSLWREVPTKKLPSLKENLSCDVVIVGGGITGLSILYNLKDSKLKTILLERDTCGLGVTSKSTAKITYLQGNIYNTIKKYSLKTAKSYLESQKEAVSTIVDIVEKEKIDCNLVRSPSYVFTNDETNMQDLDTLYKFLKSNEVDAHREIKDGYTLVGVDDTYVFHPLKYVNALKNILKNYIYEDSRVESIERVGDHYLVKVGDYTVKAKKVVIASHYPYFLIPYMMPLKTHIEVSYIGSKKTTSRDEYNAINIDKKTVSKRFYRNKKDNYSIKLIGSLKSSSVSSIKDNFQGLKSDDNYEYMWSNNDIITSDGVPYIGRLKRNDDTLLVATGFNAWGITNSTLSGKVISDILLGNTNKYEALVDPNRMVNMAKVVSFPLNMVSNIKAYAKSGKYNINNTSITYTKIDGESIAIYKDENGVEHRVLNKCPHMKCGLAFNEVEKTWDCMCHGSRFDIDGNCIEGPSNQNIKR